MAAQVVRANLNVIALILESTSMLTEQQIEALKEFNFVLVVDKSGSMGERDMGNKSRWDYMQETAIGFAREVCEFDSDGIGLILFSGSGVVVNDNCNVDNVKAVFTNNRPSGSTPLHDALSEAFKLVHKSDKKSFITVFTDGTPDDRKAAADVIRKQSNSQSTDDQCTVLFVQVGRDTAAGAYLKQLDDELTGCKFDIVDAKTIDEVEKFASIPELIYTAISD